MLRLTMLALTAAVGLGLAAESARAALVYEGFDYAPGSNALNGKTGGNGFAGAWGNQNANILIGGFSYTDTNGNQLVTGGHRAFMDAVDPTQTAPPATGAAISPIRNIAPIPGAPTTIYLSFLGRQSAGTDRDVSVSLFAATNGTFGTQERLSVGHGNGFTTWGAYATAVGTQGAHTTSPATNLAFLVARVDLNENGAKERIRLYVNPVLGAEPAVADVDFNTFNILDSFAELNRIRMRAGGSTATQTASHLEADELRVDLTYAGVTPMVPEPASATVVLLGAGLLTLRSRG